MLTVIKRQNLKKLWFMFLNVFRMLFLKTIKGRRAKLSLLQNLHPSTEIAIEKGTMIIAHSVFTRPNVCFRAAEGELKIGTSFFNQGCSITAMERVIIGDDCIFGPNIVVVDHDHDFTYLDNRRGLEFKKSEVIIGNNVWIGANAVILRGTKIGDNCVIAAGTVVKGEIPANMILKRAASDTRLEPIRSKER